MDSHELAELYRKFQRSAHQSMYPVRSSSLASVRATGRFPQAGHGRSTARSLLNRLMAEAIKPKVFISYQHTGDQVWHYLFAKLFGDKYELFTDRSIYRRIGSDDPTYQSRKIREDHISGSSLTIVLIGANTWKRKHVDWEIHSTLAKQHGLLGIVLPTCFPDRRGRFTAPSRFVDNVNAGFAAWIHWSRDPATIRRAIDDARRLAKKTAVIDNARPKLGRNLS